MTDFSLPKHAYAAFDATSLKELIRQRLNENSTFTGQNYEGSNLSSIIEDFKPETLNFNTIQKIQSSDLSKLPIISKDQRIGSCIKNPGKFIAIGLNYSDHAAETGAKAPSLGQQT